METQPRVIPEAFHWIDYPENEIHLKTMDKIQQEALAAHELRRSQMMEQSLWTWKPFEKGEWVWLEARNLKLPYKSKKIALRRLGPFKIIEEVGTHAYCIKLPEQWQQHNVFHISLLSPFKETDAHRPAFVEPPPDLIDREEEWEVEAIVGHQ